MTAFKICTHLNPARPEWVYRFCFPRRRQSKYEKRRLPFTENRRLAKPHAALMSLSSVALSSAWVKALLFYPLHWLIIPFTRLEIHSQKTAYYRHFYLVLLGLFWIGCIISKNLIRRLPNKVFLQSEMTALLQAPSFCIKILHWNEHNEKLLNKSNNAVKVEITKNSS